MNSSTATRQETNLKFQIELVNVDIFQVCLDGFALSRLKHDVLSLTITNDCKMLYMYQL